jgi:hypothetical protein
MVCKKKKICYLKTSLVNKKKVTSEKKKYDAKNKSY